MTSIEYLGLNPDSVELINSKQFRAVLDANPNLRVITVREDEETGEETLTDLTLPLPDSHNDYVAVLDSDNDELMWVLYDDCDEVYDPSPAFIEILKVMDAYSRRHLESRIFIPKDENLSIEDEVVLDAEYDYTTGDYFLLLP